MICPKCKAKNNDTAEVCGNCKLRLQLPCPYCSAMNKIGQVTCVSCKKQLLKICSECKTLNNLKSVICRKCSAKLEENSPIAPMADISLVQFGVISAELINFPTIKSKIDNDKIADKVLAKFHQIFAKQAKLHGQKAKKVANNIMIVEYKYSTSLQESIMAAFNSALDAMGDIKAFNEVLFSKYQVNLKIKIGMALSSTQNPGTAKAERSTARADEIIINQELEEFAKEKFVLESVKSQTGVEYLKLVEKIKQSLVPEIQETEIETPPENHEKPNTLPRSEIFQTILSKIDTTVEGQVIAVIGPDGIGKSSTLLGLRQAFNDDSIFWLLGECPLTHNFVPFSFFQNLFKVLFSLPQQNINVEESKKNIIEALSNKIGVTDPNIQNRLISIIFPDKSNLDKHIYANKEESMQAIKVVLEQIFDNQKTVLIIEDIEDIDPASLECIIRLLNQGILQKNVKILISGNLDTDINTFLGVNCLNDFNTITLPLNNLSVGEIDDSINGMINDKNILPLSFRNQIYENAKGLPIYFEQVLMLLMQTGGMRINPEKEGEFIVNEEVKNIKLPQDVANIIKIRINNIAQISQNAFKVICYASVLGYKFLPVLIKNILKISDQEFDEIIQILLLNGIFNTFDNYNFTFKNKTLWKIIYNLDLNKESKIICHNDINKGLMEYTDPNSAVLAENFIEIDAPPHEIIGIVEHAAQEAYSAGDDYAYTELKTIIIDCVEKTTIENKEQIKYDIYEDIGKLNFIKNPEKTIKYFSELIKYYEENENVTKVISLSGFLAKSCEITGNFSYAIECTDKAIEMMDKTTMPYEYALLNYTKLEHLLNLGRFEELVVLARTTVLPAFDDININNVELNGFDTSDIYFIELDTRYIMAKALALQGNKECLKEVNILLTMANQSHDNDFAIKAHLITALFKALQGQNSEVKTMLDGLKDIVSNTNDEIKNYLEWHFINILNNLFAKDYEALKQDLSGIVNFAMNTGSYFYQPLFKGFWGKVLVENNEIARANDIYYELINFCSENKLAGGALTLWYLLTEAEMKLQNIDSALSIAEQALDVAQNPTINNSFFIMLFQKILAKIHIAKAEFDMASMYAEQAVQLANKLDLTLWQVKLILLCGQIFKMKAVVELNERTENIKSAYKMHLDALELVKKINNKNIVAEIEASINELNQFCQTEGISV